MKAQLAMAVAKARDACRDVDDLEERVRAAMRAVLFAPDLDDGERYMAAVGAAIRETKGDGQQKLLDSCEVGAAVAAREQGAKVPIPMVDPSNVLPLVKWWLQEKAKKG